jgi:hypothetical protein
MRFDKAVAEPTENIPELFLHVIADEQAAQQSRAASLALDQSVDHRHEAEDPHDPHRGDDDDAIVIES